jgi:hypothetical protein
VNRSGKTILSLSHVWKFTGADGRSSTSRTGGLGSSTQLDMLFGISSQPDLFNMILAGSKRLITPEGMFGNNSDVLPPEPRPGGFVGAGGGGMRRPVGESVTLELALDCAVFEDGVFAGPDEGGMFQDVTASLVKIRNIAQEAVQMLECAATRGAVFDKLQPLAMHQEMARSGAPPFSLARNFANMAIHWLTNMPADRLLEFLRKYTEEPEIKLRREPLC